MARAGISGRRACQRRPGGERLAPGARPEARPAKPRPYAGPQRRGMGDMIQANTGSVAAPGDGRPVRGRLTFSEALCPLNPRDAHLREVSRALCFHRQTEHRLPAMRRARRPGPGLSPRAARCRGEGTADASAAPSRSWTPPRTSRSGFHARQVALIERYFTRAVRAKKGKRWKKGQVRSATAVCITISPDGCGGYPRLPGRLCPRIVDHQEQAPLGQSQASLLTAVLLAGTHA